MSEAGSHEAGEPDPLADWNWEDPAGLNQVMDEFTASLATAHTLERVASTAQLATLGITGIEFAAFRTTHSAGLGADLVGLRAPGASTEPGHIYRVDSECYFTQLDIAEPLLVADAALDWVYAEHLIEHVSLPTAVHWLTEVRRVLAPGGVLRLTTPDLAKYVAGYLDGDPFFAKHRRRVGQAIRVAPAMPARKAFMFNQIFYLYGHRWLYDLAELRHVLGEAGFAASEVRLCGYRSGSRDDIAELDQKFRSDESIYLEVSP